MENILNVAQYLIDNYRIVSGESLTEMQIHKLLYFAQRENIAITGSQMFAESFEGWKYGPVSRDIRTHFFNGELDCKAEPVSDSTAYILNNVILTYGSIATWKLVDMTHHEQSWINSRKGLSDSDIGNRLILIDDIKKDAEKVRPYDHVFDMYYDEFEDAEVSL